MINDHCDIICFSLSRWDSNISSPAWSIAKELSKTHRVFYIDHPFSLKDLVSEYSTKAVRSRARHWLGGEDGILQPEKQFPNLHVIVPPITIPVNFLPPGKLYEQLSLINEDRFHRCLRRLIHKFSISDYIFINFFDPFFLRSIPQDIKPLKYVYQSMDDISQAPYTAKHGTKLEGEIIKHADLTICTSSRLVSIHSSKSSNVRLIANGVDLELFSRAFNKEFEKPVELQDYHLPIVGFTGSIDFRTDFELLHKVVSAHPDKIFFMLGPINTHEHARYDFEKLENIVFAGSKPIHELPAYLQYFSCCIIPYRKNKLTASIYPLKINEYLAAGVPVVSTDFSDDIRSFSDVIHLVKNTDDFIDAIELAIQDKSEQGRLHRFNKASENSWTARVNELNKLLRC